MGGSYEEMEAELTAIELRIAAGSTEDGDQERKENLERLIQQREGEESDKRAEQAARDAAVQRWQKGKKKRDKEGRHVERGRQMLSDEKNRGDLTRSTFSRPTGKQLGLSVLLGAVTGGAGAAATMKFFPKVGGGTFGAAAAVLGPILVALGAWYRSNSDHKLATQCEDAVEKGNIKEMAALIAKLRARNPEAVAEATEDAAKNDEKVEGVLDELDDAAKATASGGTPGGDDAGDDI